MLDAIRELAAEALSVSTQQVNAVIEALLEEQATDDARYAASSALIHPEGSSTPINEAYRRAQNRLADLRAKAIKQMPAMFALLLALEVATKRRDEADAHRDMKFNADYAKEVDGVKPEVRDWWARLARHGAYPNYLQQHSEPTIAIIADLIAWKAKDATFKDPNNPWRALLGIYATRLLAKPPKSGKPARSTPGTPQRNRHGGADRHYMFNEMVSPTWGVGIASTSVASANPVKDQPTPKPQIVRVEDNSAADHTPDAALCGPPGNECVNSEQAELADEKLGGVEATIAIDAKAAVHDDADEFALPLYLNADQQAEIENYAYKWVESDDELDFDLRIAGHLLGKRPPDADVIAAVERSTDTPSVPFHYFLRVAKVKGVDAGLAAYRAACVRYMALQIATEPDWARFRMDHGLSSGSADAEPTMVGGMLKP